MDFKIEHFANNTLSYYGKTDEIIRFAPHLHNHIEWNLFLSGDICFFIDGETFQPQEGDLFLINTTQIHGPKILSNSTYERAIIHFSPKLIQSISEEAEELLDIFEQENIVHLDKDGINDFVTLTKRLEKLENAQEPMLGAEILKQSYLAQLLVLVHHSSRSFSHQKEALKTHEYSSSIQEIMRYIQENLDQHISLTSIESTFGMNKHSLNRLFKKELDITIYSFIQLNKISLAKKMLHQGMAVTKVYECLGYKDYSTFARAFKRVTNLSPKYYLKSTS